MTDCIFRACEFGRSKSVTSSPTAQVIWLSLRDTQKYTPIQDAFSLSVYRNPVVPLSVAALFLHSGPSTICRLVVLIVVFSFDGMFWRRPRPHIGIEIFETGKPTIANFNASHSIMRKTFRFWIIAASLHFAPNAPFWSLATAMGETVMSVYQRLPCGLLLEAS